MVQFLFIHNVINSFAGFCFSQFNKMTLLFFKKKKQMTYFMSMKRVDRVKLDNGFKDFGSRN